MNLGARPSARERGWCKALLTDWRRPRSTNLTVQWNCWEKVLQAIRPCRESKTGWSTAPGHRSRRNQSFGQLNEHGPALNVFWTRKSELGARDLGAELGPSRAGESNSRTDQKVRMPNGPGLTEPVQMWMSCSHLPPRARTRWVTERIASAQAMARRLASGINRRNDRFE